MRFANMARRRSKWIVLRKSCMKKAKKTAKRADAKPPPETSRPLLTVELTERFLASLRRFGKEERQAVGEAINAARDARGRPDLHGGCGLRRLRGEFFECRSGLSLRLVFEWIDGGLRFHAPGFHDEIRQVIKSL